MVPLKTLEAFFQDNDPGTEPIRLDQGTVVNSPREFVESNIEILKFVKDEPKERKRLFRPNYDRLLKLYLIIKNRN